ncbi:MAG: hypothetical protein ACRENP_05825 [Longimicrobiales bacterium]
MSAGDTVGAMANRLATTLGRYRFDATAAALIESAFNDAVAARKQHAGRASEMLHPGRTVLILLEDVRVHRSATLAAGALVDSEEPGWTVAPGRIRERYGDQIADLVAAVPQPADHGDELLEALLTAPTDVQHIALAEQFDHARHLHLRPRELWAPRHALICSAYLPVAEHIDSILGRRLRWWRDMFERRFLET